MHRTAATISALGLTAVTLLTLAACTAGDGDDTPTPSRTASATASGTASASATPGSDSGSGSGASDGDGSTTVPIPEETPADDPSEAPPSDFPATALVTYAGWDAGSQTLQASGIVSGATDTSGKCTFTASKGGTTRSLGSEAAVASTSINCAQVSFPRAQLGTGTWTVALKYSLGGKSVTSATTTVEIP